MIGLGGGVFPSLPIFYMGVVKVWYEAVALDGLGDLWPFLDGCMTLFNETFWAMSDVSVLRFFLAAILFAVIFAATLALVRTSRSLGK